MDSQLRAEFQIGFVIGDRRSDITDDDPFGLVEEFDKLGEESDRVKHVYACFGLAAYMANLVEQSLITIFLLLARLHNRDVSIAELDAVEKQQSRKTLGRMFHDLRTHVQVDTRAEAVTVEAVEMRNSLIHRFFSVYAREFESDKERREMVRELQRYMAKFQLAELLMEALTGGLLEALGIPRDSFEKYVSKIMDEWLAEPSQAYSGTNAPGSVPSPVASDHH